jgi:phage tail tape-measure protein
MATLVNGFNEQPATTLYNESFGDVGLSFTAMSGAVAGAIGGAMLGAEIGSVFPVVCGVLGTMLGSGLAGGTWCLLERLWKAAPARAKMYPECQHMAEVSDITPMPTRG